MKKRGFTLTEVLITLGIVGLAAALLTPVIGNAIPDKNKTKILKVYSSIASATEDMLSNKALYYGDQAKYDATKGSLVTACSGFACQHQPLQEPYNKSEYAGTKKYGMLLANSLGGSKIKSSGTDESAVTNFETNDGVVWQVETSNQGYSKILADLNGEKGKNCVYDKSSCTRPDQFRFYIHKNGATYPGDALMAAYLSNPLKLNDKKNDLLVASESDYDFAGVSLTPEKYTNDNGGNSSDGDDDIPTPVPEPPRPPIVGWPPFAFEGDVHQAVEWDGGSDSNTANGGGAGEIYEHDEVNGGMDRNDINNSGNEDMLMNGMNRH